MMGAPAATEVVLQGREEGGFEGFGAEGVDRVDLGEHEAGPVAEVTCAV
jgi:hypothetical protein